MMPTCISDEDIEPGMIADSCNSGTQKAEAEGLSQTHGQPKLYGEYQASLGYIARLTSKINKQANEVMETGLSKSHIWSHVLERRNVVLSGWQVLLAAATSAS